MLEVITIANAISETNAPQNYTLLVAIIGGVATIIGSVVSGIFSGIIAGAKGAARAVKSCMEDYQTQIKELTKDVEHLKTEKIKTIELRIEEHLSKDQTQGISVDLNKINCSISNLSTNVENMGKDVAVLKDMRGTINRLQDSDTAKTKEIAEQGAKIQGLHGYVTNLDNSHQRCKAMHKV